MPSRFDGGRDGEQGARGCAMHADSLQECVCLFKFISICTGRYGY